MLCPNCGKELDEAESYFHTCNLSPSSATSPNAESAAVSAAAHGPFAQRSGKAIASLLLAPLPIILLIPWIKLVGAFPDAGRILFLSYPCFSLAAGILAVRFGHRARLQIRLSAGNIKGHGMALAGLIIGYPGLAWTVFVIALAVFLPPFAKSSRQTADQSWAVAGLRSINSAANTYATTYGHGYPSSLAAMGPPKSDSPPTPPTPNENAAGLVEENLASGLRSNYQFTYLAGNTDGAQKIQTYTLHADPIAMNAMGYDHYFTDQTGVIRFESGREANERSRPIPSR